MIRTSFLSLAILTLSAAALSGCSASFAPSTETTETASLGTIQGVIHGGRQPIVGAHLFVFAAGTTGDAGPGIAAGAGNKSTSLLNIYSSGAFPTAYDSTIGGYYVTTDSGGNFSISSEYTCVTGTQIYLYSLGGKPDGVNNNSSAGLLAVLGQCGSGAFSSSTVVHINEVSTIAAAYAMAGFASDATHVSSNGSSLALTGIANAFANAGQLYDLAQQPAITARATTPNGNGVVPTTLINSLGNSLAACINSSGAQSSQCSTLFADTKNFAGTAPTDTATAAINLAHAPGSNVAAIFALPGPIGTPFTVPNPNTAPSDFTVGITYTAGFKFANQAAIDDEGNAWITDVNNNRVVKLSPRGVPTAITSGGLNAPLGIAIDGLGNAWVANADSVTKITGTNGANYPIADPNGAWFIAVDKSNSIWVSTYTDSYLYNLNQSGGNATGPYHYPNDIYGAVTPEYIAIDNTTHVWSSYGSEAGLLSLTNPGSSAVLTEYLETTLPQIRSNSQLAIDSSGYVWAVANTTSGNEGIAKAGTSGSIVSYTTDTSLTGSGVAIDGSNNIWVSNYQAATGNSVVEFNNSGTLVSPAGGYYGGNQQLTFYLAIDGSGDVWLPGAGTNGISGDGTNIVELIGAATPVVTPISPNYPGKSTTGLGVRP